MCQRPDDAQVHGNRVVLYFLPELLRKHDDVLEVVAGESGVIVQVPKAQLVEEVETGPVDVLGLAPGYGTGQLPRDCGSPPSLGLPVLSLEKWADGGVPGSVKKLGGEGPPLQNGVQIRATVAWWFVS